MKTDFFVNSITRKDLALELLKTDSICISFNPDNLEEIYGFCLYSHQQKIIVWKEYGKILFDGLIKDVDSSLFEFGSVLLNIHYPKDCNITPLIRGRFHLLPGKVLTKIFSQK